MVEAPRRPIRCAIYTRKSTDEGLEQNFNSLDAQREACEAYAASQRHEGWEVLPIFYDDGGFSGGTLDRPALKRLLADVAGGKVDVIIIYKIDRLTRSLADFARIVDVLDRASASFVSVTQSFNTTSSMGRLTLNVLLSFAQFEREVGAERVRDKIAASKRRGMWMGGVCPLGYDVRERALVVNEAEAITVREIFEAYLKLGSVRALEEHLRARGITSKVRRSRNGVSSGGAPFSRGALYVLLRNRTYIGQVTHRGAAYPGQQLALLDPGVFDRTQQLLDSHVVRRRREQSECGSPLLSGRLWDGEGRAMTPTHTSKGSRRYHYYKTREVGVGGNKAIRVPAGELESLLLARLQAFLLDPASIHDALDPVGLDAAILGTVLERAHELAGKLDAPSGPLKATLRDSILRVELNSESVLLLVDLGSLLLDRRHAATTEFVIPSRMIRRTKEVRLIVPPHRGRRSRVDAGLVKLLVRARQVRRGFENCGAMPLSQFAGTLGYQLDYCTVLLKLAYLSPSVVQSVLDGTQPPALTRQYLARIRALPISWSEQERSLGCFEVRQ